MLPQFHLVAADDVVWTMLKTSCILCQTDISQMTFREHYRAVHTDVGVGPALVLQQLQTAEWFEVKDEDFVMHFSVMLSMPVWYRRGSLSADRLA